MMFVILCYDIGIKRNAKVKKTVRKYLRPVQKSVCEGYITESKLNTLCERLRQITDSEEDSVVVYKLPDNPNLEKKSLGQSLINENFIL